MLTKTIIKKIIDNPIEYANSISTPALVKVLTELSQSYYNSDTPLVSDEIYDILRDMLEQKDPSHPFLKQVGGPVTTNMVELPFRMFGLEKIKPTSDSLEKWMQKYKGPYVLSDKLDGISGLLYKKDDTMRLYTRGTSTFGQDVSHMIPYMIGSKFDKVPNDVAIRGEIIIRKNVFADRMPEIEKTIGRKYKNIRNTLAGLVNSKKSFVPEIAEIAEFVPYAVVHPRYHQQDQMIKLIEWNLNIVNYKFTDTIDGTMLSELLKKRRVESKYDIDGIVVMDSSKKYTNDQDIPEHGFAFKMVLDDQVVNTKVTKIEWNLSKDSYFKPTIYYEPVDVGGVTLTKATAFNAKYVVQNNLGPGAVVRLVRSGDVIPHIIEVLKQADKPQMPDLPYKWNSTNVDILLDDINGDGNDTIIVKKLVYFFTTLEIKHINEGVVTKLVNNGYKTVAQILNANVDTLLKQGLSITISTILDNTRTAFETTNLETVMAASGVFGRGFGAKKLKLIVDTYPDILSTDWSDEDIIKNITNIKGFDDKTATQFAVHFREFKKFFEELESVKLISVDHLKQGNKQVAVGNVLANMKIVFTGTRDKKLEEFVISNGGILSNSVSKNTAMLVYGGEGITSHSKYIKATELKIPTLTHLEFKTKYNL